MSAINQMNVRIMRCYIFLLICVCTLGVVVAQPGVCGGGSSNNDIHSYKFPFISRRAWSAKDPTQTLPLNTPVPYVVIHHTHTPAACIDKTGCSAAMRQMQLLHTIGKRWWDVGYNFCVGSDGATYEGRGWETLGAHSLHFNTISIGICLIGDWTMVLPPDQQLNTTKDLIAAGVQQGYIRADYKIVGHRQVRETQCPGDALYEEIQAWNHYTPFPRSYKDLPYVAELPTSVKQELQDI